MLCYVCKKMFHSLEGALKSSMIPIHCWLIRELPASVAQLDGGPTGDQEVAGSTPTGSGQHSSLRFDHELFSLVILSLPLIQERQLSVYVLNTG